MFTQPLMLYLDALSSFFGDRDFFSGKADLLLSCSRFNGRWTSHFSSAISAHPNAHGTSRHAHLNSIPISVNPSDMAGSIRLIFP